MTEPDESPVNGRPVLLTEQEWEQEQAKVEAGDVLPEDAD